MSGTPLGNGFEAWVHTHLERHYGLVGTLMALPGESDRNFRFQTELPKSVPGGESQLLIKVTQVHGSTDAERLESFLTLQSQLFLFLKKQAWVDATQFDLPVFIPTREGKEWTHGSQTAAESGGGGTSHWVLRVLRYSPGILYQSANPKEEGLLRSLGVNLGWLHRSLAEFSLLPVHPWKFFSDSKWDLRNAGWIGGPLKRLGLAKLRPWSPSEAARRCRILESILKEFSERTLPKLKGLRKGFIHGDLNDYNILVSEGRSQVLPRGLEVSGFIDFGDLCYSHPICDLAIACAYAMFGQPNALDAAAEVVAAYHAVFPLQEREVDLLFSLIQMRLAVSVVNSTLQSEADPQNSYLQVSEAPAWELLLTKIDPDFARFRLRSACGWEADPNGARLTRWLKANSRALSPVLKDLGRTRVSVLDLSVGGGLSQPRSSALSCQGAIEVGRYAEPRLIYQGPQYGVMGIQRLEARTIHLGIDLFCDEGTEVCAPLAATVESIAHHKAAFDYGPTVILRHELTYSGRRVPFFSLYGHLSLKSLKRLKVGQKLKSGAVFAQVGSEAENGGWRPHLHLQLLTHPLEKGANGGKGNFPGVARLKERDLFMSLCPDPSLFAGLKGTQEARYRAASLSQLVEGRFLHQSRALSLAYRSPLHLVRGIGSRLYDENGNSYLDGVNNVCHVGHCHPRVVAAGQRQMAILNTNTRYLHQTLLSYSAALCKTLPQSLSKVFWVNSGSEANELALRMIWNHSKGQRDLVVVDTAYHGNTANLIEISPYKYKSKGGSQVAAPHVHELPLPDLYRHPGEDFGRNAARRIQELQTSLKAKGSSCGPSFIAESLLSCGGQIVLPPHYLEQIYAQIRKGGGLCVADEVQVGLGRVGSHFWGFQTQGVVPDIVTLGKPLGNGHPIGAVVTTEEVARSFENGLEFFSTFGGNPVSCAIGLSVLETIAEEKLQKHAYEVGEFLKQEFRKLQRRFSIIGDARGLGLFLGIELVEDPITKRPAASQADYVVNRMKDKGILLSTDGPYHNVIKFKPPMSFSKEDAKTLLVALASILEEQPAMPSPLK